MASWGPNQVIDQLKAQQQAKLVAAQAAQNGTSLPGAYGSDPMLGVQNELQGNLSDAEFIQQQQGDFGLGSNNNDQTNAMLEQNQGVADKYSAAFGGQATQAQNFANAANSRGLGAYQGDTSAYNSALQSAAADRQAQTGAYGALMSFAHAPQGPSAAQAQLTQATNANTANALALARSGRGMGGSASALRNATAQNAVTQQQANAQGAELMANENTAYQAQRLNALGQASGAANSLAGTDQSLANAGLAGAQYQSNVALQGQGLNDQSTLAGYGLQSSLTNAGLGADAGGLTQALNINSTALTGRENRYASMNQTHGIDAGVSTQAGIADANRQQAYIGAGLSAAGSIAAAAATPASVASDERAKTGFMGLGGGSTVAQPGGPSRGALETAQNTQTGSTVGQVGGAAIGTAIEPGIGTAIGSVAGKAIGGLIGGAVHSDIRNKENIVPLSSVFGDAAGRAGAALQGNQYKSFSFPGSAGPGARDSHNPSRAAGSPYQAISDASHHAGPLPQVATQQLDRNNPYGHEQTSAYFDQDPYSRLQQFAQGDSPNTPVATDAKGVEQYASTPKSKVTPQGYARFARDDSHPILSEGDSLLADTARSTPGSMYQYKDPADGPGTYVGPMAQDLAANPVTASSVFQGPDGKLNVDTSRLSTVNTAVNHSQQNQIDALDAQIGDLTKYLKNGAPTSYPSTGGGR